MHESAVFRFVLLL